MENAQIQANGLKWMAELELFVDEKHSKALINVLKLNVLAVSNRIKDVELLIYRERRQMLVLLDLTWIGKLFFKRRIFEEVHEVLNQVIPTFQFRVIDDPAIMNMAVSKIEKLLKGDNNEVPNTPPSNALGSSSTKYDNQSSVVGSGSETSVGANNEEQSKAESEIRPESIKTDSSKESKT